MIPSNIGLSTGCFYSRPILGVLDEIRVSGFDRIEVCSFPAHLDYHNLDDVARAGEKIHALGIHPVSFHAPFADKIDITSLDPALREMATKELLNACEAAAVLGVDHLVLHPGPERSGRPPEEEFMARMRHATESLNIVAKRCCELNIHLLLENMLPHLLFGHVNDMLYLLGSIRDCEVGACLDTGHAYLSRELGVVANKLSGHLQLIHVNDNRGDHDDHLPPGEGHIDWPWFISELKRWNYSGNLILELSSHKNESVADMLNRARQSREYLTNLM